MGKKQNIKPFEKLYKFKNPVVAALYWLKEDDIFVITQIIPVNELLAEEEEDLISYHYLCYFILSKKTFMFPEYLEHHIESI